MSITKVELANKILKILGLNSRFTDAAPEQVKDVIGYAQDWFLSQNAQGMRLGWVIGDNVEDETGIPDWSIMGSTYSIAVMIAPYFDKNLAPSIHEMAAQGMQTITTQTIAFQRVQYPNRMPRGTGNQTTYTNKYYRQADRITTNGDFLEDEGGSIITSGDSVI